jgi:hypothetical protein
MDYPSLLRMYQAQTLGLTMAEAGFPNTLENQAQWDRCAAQIAEITARGGVVELPQDS